jgi:hypothetical protein
VSRRQIALLCYAAGLTLVGASVAVDAIGRRFFDCDPDSYFPEYCTAQEWAYLGIIVACWLVATYLVARREAIGPFACVFMGLMLGFGLVTWAVLADVVRLGSWRQPFPDLLGGVLVATIIIAVPIGLLTAAVGYPMQVFIVARRKRLGRPAAERPARTTGGSNSWVEYGPGVSVTKSCPSVQGKAPQRRAATGLPSWVRPTEWTEVGTSRTSCTRS